MPIDRRFIKRSARESLCRASYSPGKLVFIHTGCTMLLGIAVALVHFLLEMGMESAGGLGGMDRRAILSTAQTLLVFAQAILLPFWQFGHPYACLRIARDQDARPGDLLQGFRLLGPVVRLMLLEFALYFILTFAASQGAMVLFSFMPHSESLMALMESGNIDPEAMMDPAFLRTLYPYYIILAAAIPALIIPAFYRLRMAEFCLMDRPQEGALRALIRSGRLMRGNCLALFKLDLSFWWFMVLELLIAALAYGDLILPALGVSFPWPVEVSYFGFYLLSLIAQLALYVCCKNRLGVSYAHVYEVLDRAEQPAQ